MAYEITSGIIHAPVKVVVYGPEGIGKSTFAAQFPDPVFIDTEGGTGRLNVRRLPRPTSWAMLLDECQEVRKGNIPCKTLVVDTADWAERLGIEALCKRAKVDGLEGFGYGKGYVYVKEEFGKLLDILEDVKNAGYNVVVTAHAQISKFEQPDEMGSYDRWCMKTTKHTAPLLREWCDMLLFANFRTYVVKDGDGKMAKNKGQGGQTRVMYTTHHACWDAKNRFGLPEECAFEYAVIAPYISPVAPAAPAPVVPMPVPVSVPEVEQAPKMPTPTKPVTDIPTDGESATNALRRSLMENGVPEALADLMAANDVTEQALQRVVGERGYFPADMPIEDYPMDFVNGCLIAAWDSVLNLIMADEDLPF
ncbi:MAG: ATP-binding protein [Clostridia bacterium]|nr:ATP-binding protein [Clostridia bacterium]